MQQTNMNTSDQLAMQQQIAQQQMAQQQMMLCPVRVVYETQILVQPGEQIQPNQTILINPQNPPPWIQNRPMQNQVLYVQQFPTNNIIPSVQQHMDPNQFILQQNMANLQQYMPQQILTQNSQEQMRPMQIQYHTVPNELVQNMQANIAQNNQNTQNERVNEQNNQKFNVVQSNEQNVQNQMNQNQINMSNVVNKQIVNSPQSLNQAMMQRNQQMQMMQQIYGNIGNQVNQQFVNVQRPPTQQIVTMNPSQSIQNINQMTNVRPTHQTMQPRPVYVQNVPVSNATSVQQSYQMANNIQMVRAVKPGSPMLVNKPKPPENIGNAVRPVNQSYRPIQPRPQQYRTNNPNNTATNVNLPPSNNHQSVQNSYNLPKQDNSPVISTNIIKIYDNSSTMNRKRKSESPDEIQKKMMTSTATQVNSMTVTKLQNNLIAKGVVRTEIGTNTSPTHKAQKRTNAINIQPLPNPVYNQVRPNTPTSNIIATAMNQARSNINSPINNPVTITQIPNTNVHNLINNVPPSLPIQKTENNEVNATTIATPLAKPTPEVQEKHVRNTVFTQARGRVLSDKIEIKPIELNEVKPPETTEVKPMGIGEDNKIKEEIKPTSIIEPIKLESPIPTSCNSKPSVVLEAIVKPNMPDLKPKIEEKMELDSKEVVKEEVKRDIVKVENKQTSVDNLKEKQIHLSEGHNTTKEEREFILTHVLDGFVIQESNIAFPIRKPLQEKLIVPNATVEQESKTKEVEGEKVLDISTLQLNEAKKEVVKEEHESLGDNPFEKLETKSVKTWTVEDLAKHLGKYGWSETISMLREHEIDGESLFLVTKPQLMHIGVSENHADIICEFVKS